VRTLTVLGEPVAKGRPRIARGHAYTPERTAMYEGLVRMAYLGKYGAEQPYIGEVAMHISAYFAIPKSASKKRRADMASGVVRPTKRPDCDNVAKIVMDALNGLAYEDDCQVVDCVVGKHYSGNPRVEVIIYAVGVQA